MNSQINQPSKGGGGGGTRLSRGGWPGNGGVRGDGDTRGGRGEDGGFVDVVVTAVVEGGGGGVELVTRMAAGVWGSDDGDGHEGGVMVAAVGRQPEEVEARGGEWIWGSGRSGHEDNIWFRPERSPENFSGGGGMVAGGGGRREGWPEIWRRWRRERVI
ncbi:hypothetical protein Tco_1271526 [Tanacetum coccineum]